MSESETLQDWLRERAQSSNLTAYNKQKLLSCADAMDRMERECARLREELETARAALIEAVHNKELAENSELYLRQELESAGWNVTSS